MLRADKPRGVPDFLVVGNITRDREPGGYRLGGTASYAALTASRLGMRVAVLTSFAADIDVDLDSELPGVEVAGTTTGTTTTFENVYDGRGRRQRVHALAGQISPAQLPVEWKYCPVVLLGPVTNELDPSFAALFPGSIMGISPQGWLRQWDRDGWVSPRYWSGEGVVDRADVVVLSEHDYVSWAPPNSWGESEAVLVVTQGERGAILTCPAGRFRIPPYPALSQDTTGAGDVFAAAYLVSYYRSRDPLAAALYASCAASLSTEEDGLAGVPTAEQIELRMATSPQVVRALGPRNLTSGSAPGTQ